MKKRVSLIAIMLILCFCLTSCKRSDYKEAVSYQEAGDFESAVPLFEELGDYKDAATRLKECQNSISYEKANALIAEKDFSGAKDILTELGDYSDSSDLVKFCDEMISAIDTFNAECEALSEKNDSLNLAIDNAEKIVTSEEKALNESLRPELETVISETKAAKVEIPEISETASEIASQAAELASVDYTAVLTNLASKQTELENSIHQYALVNQPSEAYIIERLGNVPGVTGISAATEDNDPNEHLGKAGWYIAAIFFSHENVDQNSIDGSTIIEKGTAGGGQIEVYSSEQDAINREEYLASFNGTIFSTGSHTVIGTCVIRTSDKLTASQQKELETNVITALTALD